MKTSTTRLPNFQMAKQRNATATPTETGNDVFFAFHFAPNVALCVPLTLRCHVDVDLFCSPGIAILAS